MKIGNVFERSNVKIGYYTMPHMATCASQTKLNDRQ